MAPSTTVSCNGGSCAGPFSSPVTVALPSSDVGGSGTKSVYYTTNGVDPAAPGDLYTGSFSLSATATVKFFAVDNVGNTETINSQLITITAPTPPVPTLTPTESDAYDFVNGSTVYFNPNAAGGGFTVGASSSGADSLQFPPVFAPGTDGGSETGPSASHSYVWSQNATLAAIPPFQVTASSSGGTSGPAVFTVTADGVAPSTTVSCNGGSCAGPFSSPVTVALPSSDVGGSGTKSVYYTTNGVDPAAPGDLYTGSFSLSATATVKFFAVDNVGNTETINSQLITITAPTPPVPTLTPTESDAYDFVNGSTVYFNPNAAGGGFTVGASSSGADSLQFPPVFAPGTDGGSETGPSASHSYVWSQNATLAAIPPFQVTASSSGGTSGPAVFTVTADGVAPSTTVSCNGGSCAGPVLVCGDCELCLPATGGGRVRSRLLHDQSGRPDCDPGSICYTGPSRCRRRRR